MKTTDIKTSDMKKSDKAVIIAAAIAIELIWLFI